MHMPVRRDEKRAENVPELRRRLDGLRPARRHRGGSREPRQKGDMLHRRRLHNDEFAGAANHKDAQPPHKNLHNKKRRVLLDKADAQELFQRPLRGLQRRKRRGDARLPRGCKSLRHRVRKDRNGRRARRQAESRPRKARPRSSAKSSARTTTCSLPSYPPNRCPTAR